MFEKGKLTRDAFAFSLGGAAAKSSFAIMPAIADDRINKAVSKRIERVRSNYGQKPRSWLQSRRQNA